MSRLTDAQRSAMLNGDRSYEDEREEREKHEERWRRDERKQDLSWEREDGKDRSGSEG